MKILMALMSLGIGGAETHVVELCKKLKSMGYEIFVVSNGGVYVKELEEAKIKHFKLPLHNKNLFNMCKAYFGLKKIIIKNKIKLVHAHARIPAFLCGLLKKKLGFRFVTTAHWIFKTSFLLNKLSNWGEKTLAVSDDIKKYLIDNYKLDEKNIKVTINGIDINKFCCEINYDDIVKEFELKDKKYVVYVSRLDNDRSLCAHKILEIAKDLYEFDKDLRIIIVGGGNDEINIKNKAEMINKSIGEKIIYLTGARVDINKFLALGKIFIGVSRAALEAMATKKAIILAGNEGYIGIFDESKLEKAIETNFCCRDCEKVDSEKLLRDIKKLLSLDEKKLDELGNYCFDIVNKYYSVDRMANDALEIYEKLRYEKKKWDVIISGYYGFNNNGDDMVLKSIVDNLKKSKPDIKIMVLSKKPLETSKIYGVDTVYRYNFFLINKYIKQAKLLISGGGSLIQDVTSTHSLKYYLWIINRAIENNISVMLYANGIGPVLKKNNMAHVKKILNRVDLITLRDKNSFEILKKIGVEKPVITVTADAVFGLNFDFNKRNVLEKFDIRKKFFVVSVRAWKHNGEHFEKNMAVLADFIFKKYDLIPVFVPMQPKKDFDITKKIIGLMQNREYAKFLGVNYFTGDLISLIAKAEFILAMRLHTIIYAIKTATPILGLIYDPKVKGIMDEIDLSYYVDVKEINLTQLKSFVDKILNEKTKISRQIKIYNDELKMRARENNNLALKLLEKKMF